MFFIFNNVKPRYTDENGHCACAVSETTKNLETLTPICIFTMQLSGGYDDD